MSKIAGFDAVVWRDGVKIDDIRDLTFPAGSLEFDGATVDEISPGIHDMVMQFTATWDYAVGAAREFANAVMAHPEFRREYSKWRAMFQRRERKRWRRYQRQKRKQ